MCGRSSLSKTEKELEERFNATFYSDRLVQYNPLPNFNVAPSHIIPIITNLDKQHFNAMRWGLIPFWAKDSKIGFKMINARKETLLEKKAFKPAMEQRRCLVPADGFYEWQKKGSKKQAYRIKTTDREIFSMAGIWDSWTSPDGEKVLSFSIITQEPNEIMKPIHNRMPAILTPEQESLWISNDLSPQVMLDMITPYPSELMEAYPVSNEVGNVKNNHKGLIKKKDPDQLELF